MLRKFFVFILLSTLTCIVTFAQDTPKSDEEEKARKVYSLAFSGGGSYMGVEIKEITRENFAELGLSEVRGVAVSKVVKDSPAEKAGLQTGDVIVRFNGEKISSRRQLTRMISEVAPDHKANLAVVRGGAEIEIPITMGKRPVPQLFTGNFEMPKLNIPPGEFPDVETVIPRGKGENSMIWRYSSGRSIGVAVTPLTDQLGNYFGVGDGKGLLVKSVTKDGPAEKAGLQAGDVIVEIDGKKISGTSDLIRSIYEKKEGSINLTVIRDKRRQTVTITPEERKGGESFFNGNVFPFPYENLKVRVAPKVEGFSMPVIIGDSDRVL